MEERLQFWLVLLTRWLLAELLFAASATMLAPFVTRRFLWPLLIVLAMTYVFIRFQKIGDQWRLTALLVFSLLLGVLFGLWLPDQWRGRLYPSIFIGFSVAFLAAVLGGRFLPASETIRRLLSISSWAYLAGWLLMWRLPFLEAWGRVWAQLGFALFLLLTGFWSASLAKEDWTPGVMWVELQLFLLSLNLTLPALFLLSV